MATTLPTKLKVPTIQPFAVRATQLEIIDPVVAHWCRYYIVQTIITKGLHEADDECREYTSQLMDKLEETKSQDPTNQLIQPNDSAQAHVEKFALDTFARADNAIHSNCASRQTVETFQAASNFMELLTVFGPVRPDIASKIKYAKYHALRIVKAIRAGEDPNASNPKDETEQPFEHDTAINQASLAAPTPYKSPTVESAPESVQPSRTSSVPPAAPLADAPPSSVQTPVETQPPNGQSTISPIESPASSGPKPAEYFPPPTLNNNTSPAAQSNNISPESFYQPPSQPTPVQQATMPQTTSSIPFQPQPSPLAQVQSSAPNYRADDEAIVSAQKHAKWAISALNFEDVNTAVKELRIALQALGAS